MENLNSARRYDLDWLRFIAILLLLFFHTGMLFNSWEWHIKNKETSSTFDYWMVWSHFWRMPLLLFISGGGTYMAMGERTKAQFTGERFKRLFIPLVFGMFIIVPPQIFFERINLFDSYSSFYKTVFEFIPYPKGSFSWHHLWFIAYLFVFSLLALPLLAFLRSEKSDRFKSSVLKVFSSPVGILLIPASFILLTQVILRPYFPDDSHDFRDWALFTFYFCFFIFGMISYSSSALWESIGKNRRHILVACLFALIPFYIFFMSFYKAVILPWDGETVEIMFKVSSVFVSWFTVITIIAYGQHYLNRSHPWLSKINEGLYPFYILHQTVIIAIGYYICQLPWSISAKYWVVSLLTLASCVGFYLIAIRPINAMRIVFGMKPLKKKQVVVEERVEAVLN